MVEVDAKENKLIIKKKSDNKSVDINLKHIAENDWKDLYFCVNLNSVGDKVQLLGWNHDYMLLNNNIYRFDGYQRFAQGFTIGFRACKWSLKDYEQLSLSSLSS